MTTEVTSTPAAAPAAPAATTTTAAPIDVTLAVLREAKELKDLQKGEILVKTKDDKSYAVERFLFRHSKLINDILADTPEGQEPEVPLADIDAENLHLIVTYLSLYKSRDPKSPQLPMICVADSFQLFDQIEVQDRDFINKLVAPGERDPRVNMTECKRNVSRIRKLMIAANFLAIKTLTEITTCALADYLRDPKPWQGNDPPCRTPEEIIEMFDCKQFVPKWTEEDKKRGLQLLPELEKFLPKEGEVQPVTYPAGHPKSQANQQASS